MTTPSPQLPPHGAGTATNTLHSVEYGADAYAQQNAWRRIQQFLPPSCQFDADCRPREEYWPWRGHTVHLDRMARPDSAVKLILLHGVGTNGRQLAMIVGAPLYRRGIETVAVDLPGYGMTRVAPRARVRYDDWVDLVCDLIDAEHARDGRPVLLYGLSAGGMLAYHAAARHRRVAGIVGMTFLDQREQTVRDATAYNKLMSRVGGAFARWLARTPLAGLKMPMRIASKMHTLVNDPAALKIFLADKSSAGNWATLRFLHSYLSYQPAVEPEEFDVCPLLLTQPAQDAWTPQALSELFLRRLRQVDCTRVRLDRAGHYPLEQPGLEQMADAIADFCTRVMPRQRDTAARARA